MALYLHDVLLLEDTIVPTIVQFADMREGENPIIKSSRVSYLRTWPSLRKVVLGTGGFGQVYQATLRGWSEPVAVKRIEFGSGGARDVQSCLRELGLLSTLRSPYIVEFLGAYADNSGVSIVLELMKCGDASSAIHTGLMQWGSEGEFHSRAVKVALSAARGLEYLHSRKIVHLDIKPSNILIAHDWSAKLGDVGLSKHITNSQVRSETGMGTFAYAAPELLGGDRPVTVQADIFSIGITLWELETTTWPRRGCLDLGEAPLLAKLIGACLAYEPSDRPSANELIVELEHLAQQSPRPESAGSLQPDLKSFSDSGQSSTVWEEAPWSIHPNRITYALQPDGTQCQLGSGFSGRVYQGLLDGNHPVAIKMFEASADNLDEKTKESMAEEVAKWHNCRHANIALVLGAWLGHDMYIVMELLPTDLYTALADPHIAASLRWDDRGKSIAHNLAVGLAYLHSKNIVHLDIRSINVRLMSGHSCHAKIADNGLAHILDLTHYSMDEPPQCYLAWMAPEMLMGLICSSKSDIYSLGVPFISFMHHLTHCSKAYDVHHLMLATGIRDGSGS